jgi:hypothetical protein
MWSIMVLLTHQKCQHKQKSRAQGPAFQLSEIGKS